jgi:glutamine synthetase
MAFTQIDTIKSISMHISGIKIYTDHMVEERKKVNAMNSIRDQAMYYGENINISFDKIRYHVDKLELIVDDQLWPLAKYREMLFAR